MRREVRPYHLVLLAVASIFLMLTAVWISNRAADRAIRESERRQCESVASDVAAYQAVPPTTDAGKAQLRSKVELMRAWDCPRPTEKELSND